MLVAVLPHVVTERGNMAGHRKEIRWSTAALRGCLCFASIFALQHGSAMAQASINLNGGKITDLAPGESSTDAVNVSQLRAEADARRAADAAEALARANGDSRLGEVVAEVDSRLGQAITDGDNRLGQRIGEVDARLGQAITDGDSRLGQAITDGDTRLGQAVAEVDSRLGQAITNGDTRLGQAVAAEAAARTEADRNLLLLISNIDVNGDVIRQRFDAEATARTAAIAAEAEARAAGDARTTQLVQTESQLRASGDEALSSRLDAEGIARVAGLSAEAEARIKGDERLGIALADETTARVKGDGALQAALQNEMQQRLAADSQEASIRASADEALGSRIDAETSQRKLADAILRDRIASSTAAAIALGGGLVLPGADYTLSGNLGVYQGAQAIAINGAARVSDNAYVTGALGGGLNKHGSVGARVGFAVGF
ncbi:MAG: YadA-like family protein [Novosphingobium sp.]|nr:YadA-like family protein [Novosphingobium sp.]